MGGIKKGDVIKTEYYVRYDECPNDLWHFPLLTDLKKGDLIILMNRCSHTINVLHSRFNFISQCM